MAGPTRLVLRAVARRATRWTMTNPLDRPIWHALAGRQARFAAAGGGGLARCFVAEMSPFVACRDDGDAALAAVAGLVPDGGELVFLQRGAAPVPPGTIEVERLVAVQMVAAGFAPTKPPTGVVALGADDGPAMLALAALAQPGPFRRRTPDFSQFWGVKDGAGALLAMAGERLKLAGMSEVSGVCTDPGARGRGLAELLSRHVASEIARRGETPFLHARAGNDGAIRLYQRLGFRWRCDVSALVVRRG